VSIRIKQCAKCPWRKDVDPRDIPGGYCETKHKNLAGTIAEPGTLNVGGPLVMMACHETPGGREQPCVGWLAHQLGPGNNIGLRLWASKNLKRRLKLAGEQHECFEDTLPDAEPEGSP
jgi:hypothetical protein